MAVTTSDTAPQTSDVKEDGAEMDKITSDTASQTSDVKEDGAEMDKTSDIASQTSDVKEDMGSKWIKQPAALP